MNIRESQSLRSTSHEDVYVGIPRRPLCRLSIWMAGLGSCSARRLQGRAYTMRTAAAVTSVGPEQYFYHGSLRTVMNFAMLRVDISRAEG